MSHCLAVWLFAYSRRHERAPLRKSGTDVIRIIVNAIYYITIDCLLKADKIVIRQCDSNKDVDLYIVDFNVDQVDL